MDLKQHLRLQFSNKIRPLMIKDMCECCGDKENLHLHHEEKHFATLLNETFEELKITYKENIDDYDNIQLYIIENIMLGKQVRIKYSTLCKGCHDNVHVEEGKDWTNYRKWRESQKILKEHSHHKKVAEIHNEMIRIENEKLDKKEISEVFKGVTGRTTGISSINKFMKDNYIPFYVESKRTSRWVNGSSENFTYWVIRKYT